MQPITTRQELVSALKDVAELEQQFMCMYLYAAFSLKKNPDASCNAGQIEAVRRWTSRIYMIARQEMEHLALVNGMLGAIGAPPHFTRQNIPVQSPHFLAKVLTRASMRNEDAGARVKCDLPFLLEPFDLLSARRYACMESAELKHLPPDQKKRVLDWCFTNDSGGCPCVLPSRGTPLLLHRSYSAPPSNKNDPGDVQVGTIEEAYHRLREGFETIAATDPTLFVMPSDERQVSVLSEYNIFIFPITGLESVRNAIDLITEQGEGLGAPPGFDSHFLNFLETAEEYQALLGVSKCGDVSLSGFQACRPVPSNPDGREIQDAYTRRVFDLFNYCYATLLYTLTGLYGWYQMAETKYPYFSTALREIAFAQMMTMMLRSLAEVLVQLPLGTKPGLVAAPNFFINPEEDHRLTLPDTPHWQSAPRNSFYQDINFYLDRLENIDSTLKGIAADAPAHLKTDLEYMSQNVYRTAGNLRRDYQKGVYKKFVTTS